jgi:hypothetical protein
VNATLPFSHASKRNGYKFPTLVALNGLNRLIALAYSLHIRSCEIDIDLKTRRNFMSNILLIVLVRFMLGALPLWPYSANWGYYPGGGLGILLLIAIIITFTSRRSLT